MLKVVKVLGLAALVVLVCTTSAFAAGGSGGDDVFSKVLSKGKELFKAIRNVVFVLGGFGLVGLAVASIFGRPMWKWFGALALGLVTIAVAGAVVDYFGGTSDAQLDNTLDS